ncbi:MAG: pkn [Planctomycetota bacterium]|nr:pkn [Planctomycetota bacterium]
MASPDPRLMSVFSDALVHSDPVARAAFLDGACRCDAGLRRLVEELLAAHDGAGRFLEPTPTDAPEAPPAATLAHSGEAEAACPSGSGSITAAYDPEAPGAPPASVRLADGAEGTVIAGRYKLLQQIGEGGMGTVWMADQTEPVKRRVAVKLIRVQQGGSRTILSRFEAERQAIALMDHPHIAKLLDAGTTPDGAPFFVMELVKGIPLNEYCDEHKLGIHERLQLFTQICSAVQHAHQKGIIHRDLKPTNILVESHDGKPMPKVIDFGLAKATSGLQLSEGTLFTAFGSVMGTPMYMAPEQANFNAVDVDTRADVYTLGVILYELLTGTTPITRESMKKAALDEMLRLIREQEAPTPSSRLSGVNTIPSVAANRQMEPRNLGRYVKGELDWIVMKALSKERDRRYETANGFARDIERFLNNEAVAAGPPSATYRLRKFARRNRGRVLAAGLLMLTLMAGVAGTSWGLYRAAKANSDLAAKNRALAAEQLKVQARENQAIDAVKRFGDAVSNNKELKDNPALEPLRKTLLKEPLEFFMALREQLQADHDTRPEALARLASAAYDMGDLTDSIGDKQDALRSYQEARGIRERLARENPTVTKFQSDLALSHNNIGTLLHATGKPAQALAAYEQARGIRERLARENPTVNQFQSDLAASHNGIGALLHTTGKPAQALAAYEQAQAIWERLARENPTVTKFQSDLAGNHFNIGVLLLDTGKPAEALAAYEQGRAIYDRLARENPTVTHLQSGLAHSHYGIGVLLGATGKPAEALAAYEQARAIQERLARDHPESSDFASDLGATLNNHAVLDLATHRFAEARDRSREAIVWQRKALAANPRNPTYRQYLTNHVTNHIKACNGLNDTEGAAEARRQLAELQSTDPRFQALDQRLDALIRGEAAKDNAERLALAQRAHEKSLHAAAARLLGEALAINPTLGDDRRNNVRYNAACAAALAVGPVPTGRPESGRLEPALQDAEKAKLRAQALDWLKAELSAWKKVSFTIEPGSKELVAKTLAHWKADADLTSLRDDAALAKLPEDERAAFERLWADIDGLLTSVGGGK